MCTGNDCLVYYFLLILIGFAVLIYFLLKSRASFQKENLEITADEAWGKVEVRAKTLNLSKSDMLFGIWQDASTFTMCLLIKDIQNKIVGKILTSTGSRKKEIVIGDDTFLVEFPLSWNRTAILYAPNSTSVIATFKKTSWLFGYQYDVAGYGLLKSKWPGINSKSILNYKLDDKLIGTIQNISASREIGKLIILPSDLSLEVRLFIFCCY